MTRVALQIDRRSRIGILGRESGYSRAVLRPSTDRHFPHVRALTA